MLRKFLTILTLVSSLNVSIFQKKNNYFLDLKLDKIPKKKIKISLSTLKVPLINYDIRFKSFSNLDKYQIHVFKQSFLPNNSIIDTKIYYNQSLVQSFNWKYISNNSDYIYLYRKWKDYYGKRTESPIKFLVFINNTKIIQEHNRNSYNFQLSLNYDSDKIYNYTKNNLTRLKYQEYSKGNLINRVNLDHRENGLVTEVKHQGNCGSCWAYAASGALEGVYAYKYGKLYNFSYSQLIECDNLNNGCQGGSMIKAYQWIGLNEGLCTEEDYLKNNTMSNSSCEINTSKVKGYRLLEKDNDKLIQILNKHPIAIGITTDCLQFQFYSKGIFNHYCGNELDHGALLVGYGYDKIQDKNYWLVKNSWGTDWGEEGYIRIHRNLYSYDCGILEIPSYPII